jgi:glycosyltransferase involved in cell wall biosynthesis
MRPRVAEVPTAMSGKTVWFVNQYAGSESHGMEFRHFFLAKKLLERGHRVIVVSGSYSHLYSRPPSIRGNYTFESVDGVDYWWIRVPRYRRPISAGRVWNMAVFAMRLAAFPTKRLPTPDVIVVSSPSIFPVMTGRRWARRFAARFIFEVRDLWPLTLVELASPSPRNPLVVAMQWLEDYGLRTADRVVSVLPCAEEYMVERGMRREKFVYIPNGIDASATADRSEPDGPTAMRNHFVVGFVGSLTYANALESLLRAAALLRDESIHILIAGAGNQREELARLARQLPNVTFVDAVPKHEVQALVRSFDACYLGMKRRDSLYRFGVSPNKLFEYMLAGRPVIWAIESGNRPVDEAQCGISVEAEDPESIADGIRRLSALPPADLRRLGENGRQYVLRHHEYSQLADDYERVFEPEHEET